MKYPKINTLWKRDGTKKNLIVPGEFSCPEFSAITSWQASEKIDGMNIRITYTEDDNRIRFDGRTDNAQIPANLVNYLKDKFTIELFEQTFDPKGGERIILFCEGFGPGIQKAGKLYGGEQRVILFDVVLNEWWLRRDAVASIANTLDIECVALLADMPLEEIIRQVQYGFNSDVGAVEAEGVVVRSNPMMLFRDTGTPIMWKLKTSDYERLGDATKTR